MPVSMDTQCLTHQPPGPDNQLTLKLFKIACLAYKPSDVEYRSNNYDRMQVIQFRRGLIDKITQLIPKCNLF